MPFYNVKKMANEAQKLADHDYNLACEEEELEEIEAMGEENRKLLHIHSPLL